MSNQQQYYAPPPPAPKKKMSKQAKIGFGIFGGLIALILVLAPFAGNETTVPSSVVSQPAGKQVAGVDCSGQENRTEPCPITVGKPFQLGRHVVLDGWTVSEDAIGSVEMTGKAQNVSNRESSMLIEVKFLNGNEVVMDLQCSTDQLEPGQVQTINCLSADNFTKQYNRVTAEALF